MNTKLQAVQHRVHKDKATCSVTIVSEETGDVLCGAIIHEREHLLRVMGVYCAPEHRRQGFASQIMDDIVVRLDRIKKVAYIEVDSFDTDDGDWPSPDDEQLRYWYGRFGFDDVPGHPFAMVRYPK